MGSRTWALVTDGVRARILRRLDGVDGEDTVEMVSTTSARHLRESLASQTGPDDPDKADEPLIARGGRADPVRKDMEDFARETLAFLEGHHRAHHFERLAIFAPPAMLSILRRELPASLGRSVAMDRAVNLITLPERQLRERVVHLIHEHDTCRST